MTTTKIGSGRPKFILPGDRFLNATKPLALSGKAHDQSLTRLEDKETKNGTENHARCRTNHR